MKPSMGHLLALALAMGGCLSDTSAGADRAPAPVGEIEAAANYTCHLRPEGTVACWGTPVSVWPGIGSPDTAETLPGLEGVVDLDLGVVAGCVVLDDGTAKCWGKFANGSGFAAADGGPVAIEGVNDAVAVEIIGAWSIPCFLSATGVASCPGTEHEVNVPNAVGIATGNWYGCALHADGTATCWDGRGEWLDLTAQVTDATALSGGDPSCAIHRDGRVSCTVDADWIARQWIEGILDPRQSDGSTHGFSCVIAIDRSVKCWGLNSLGQLGVPSEGEGDQRTVPVLVPHVAGAVQIGLGIAHGCVLDKEGAVTCWGANGEGQLGVYGPGQ